MSKTKYPDKNHHTSQTCNYKFCWLHGSGVSEPQQPEGEKQCSVCDGAGKTWGNEHDYLARKPRNYTCIVCKGTGKAALPPRERPRTADSTDSKLLEAIELSGNEFAMGYDDSGCFWRFYYGSRGAGSMMDGWPQFVADTPDPLEALSQYIAASRGITEPTEPRRAEATDAMPAQPDQELTHIIDTWLWNYEQNESTTAMLIDKLSALITQQVNKARVEELYRLGNNLIPGGQSDGSKLGEYLEQRISELTKDRA